MTDEKPLHVQVAEALGWEKCEERKGGILLPVELRPGKGWYGIPPRKAILVGKDNHEPVADFDTDWAATGPLIEAKSIELTKKHSGGWFATIHDDEGEPSCHHIGVESGFAPCGCEEPTPLLAVCRLLVSVYDAREL